MAKVNNTKIQNIDSGDFRVRIVEQLCADRRKLTKLAEVFAEFDMQLATYL